MTLGLGPPLLGPKPKPFSNKYRKAALAFCNLNSGLLAL
jgi:hypothetical protein